MNIADRILSRVSVGRSITYGLVAVVVALAGAAEADEQAPYRAINAEVARSKVTAQHLRGDLHVLMGGGGNIVALAAPEGFLLVDTGIALARPKIQAALDGIRRAPLRWAINTHFHWDHIDGNAWVRQAGAAIVAHEKLLERMSSPMRVEDWGYSAPAAPRAARPTVTFRGEKRMSFGGERIVVRNLCHGHTDGDALVYFERSDVLALGDTFWNGAYPFIDNPHGGSIDDTIRWVDAALDIATPRTLIVPGHGPIGGRAELLAYRAMLVDVRDRIAALVIEGRTLTEVIDARPTAAYDRTWGAFAINPTWFTRLVYAGVVQSRIPRRPVSVADDARLSRGTKAFLAALNGSGAPALETLPPAAARDGLATAQASVKVDLSGIEETQRTITAGRYELLLDIVRPAKARGRLPVFVFVHGGGWVLGDYPTHRRLVRDLVVRSGYAAVFVNYTRTPEARYPQPVEEVYASTSWVAKHGAEIGVDGTRLAIVGSSVGGNMSAATCIMAKERGGPAIKAQILLWPIVDHDFETESYRQFGAQRFLSTPLMKWMYDLYTNDAAQRREIHASPLRATIEQLRGLPPALVVVAESDVLRDEGEAYGRKLDAAGVETTTVRFDGMIHDFGMLNALAREPGTLAMLDLAAARLRVALAAP